MNMTSSGDTPQKGGPQKPKRNLLSILITVGVLALLLFTPTGRELLGNLLNQDQEVQTTNKQQSEQNAGRETGTDTAETKKDQAQSTPDGRLTAKVERTVDGDTFIAELQDGSRERVRMLLIDTPETKKEGTPVQPFGPEASDYTKKLLTGREIELQFDKEPRDQYDRMLAYVYLNGELVNEKLLEQGLARVVVYQPNEKYVKAFREIQAQAKGKKLGVWSIEGYADNRGFHPEKAE
ncbi:hypothetical protein B9G55_12875 [Saccharibacillus sp. O16]|nr:hypothetical protein B9G55_12875 [Saccharibacillus sp. O16]